MTPVPRLRARAGLAAACALALALVAMAAATAPALRGDDGPARPTRAARPVGLDGLLRTTLSAAAVRTPSGTYVALGGRDATGAAAARVVLVGADGTRTTIAPPGPAPDGQVGITRLGARPCLTYAVRKSPFVACLEGSAWHELRFTGAQRLDPVPAARRCWTTICVLQATPRPGGRLGRAVLRWTGTAWRPAGPELPAWKDAIVALGERDAGASAGPPIVGVVHGPKAARRRVLALAGGRWRDAVPTTPGLYGPLVDGPLAAAGRTAMATTDSRRHPWTFAVLTWPGGSEAPRRVPLSAGHGNAQGEVSLVGGQLWAAWQEQRAHQRGTFLNDTEYWVARIESDTGRVARRHRIWSGLTGFPLRLGVVDVAGDPYILWLEHRLRAGEQVTVPRLEPLGAR